MSEKKSLAQMSDDEIVTTLNNYVEELRAGVVDFSNELEVSTDELMFLSIALEYVERAGENNFSKYADLWKNVEGEVMRRAGQMPLK